MCYSCKIGYEVSDNTCVDIGKCADIPDCISCDSTDPSKCDKCYNYLTPSADGSLCECETGSDVGCIGG